MYFPWICMLEIHTYKHVVCTQPADNDHCWCVHTLLPGSCSHCQSLFVRPLLHTPFISLVNTLLGLGDLSSCPAVVLSSRNSVVLQSGLEFSTAVELLGLVVLYTIILSYYSQLKSMQPHTTKRCPYCTIFWRYY